MAGEPDPNPYGFTGRERDETGLYYFRNRYYHPRQGRFLSEDPLEYDAGYTNLYTYAGGDPVNYVDPDGQQAINAYGCGVLLGALLAASMERFEESSDLILEGPGIDDSTRRSIILERNHRANIAGLELFVAVCGGGGIGGAARFSSLSAPTRLTSFGRGTPLLNRLFGRAPATRPATTFRAPPPRTGRPPAGRACSFSADTEVLLADGTTAPISDIETGDRVLATAPRTGEQGSRQVTATSVHQDTLLDLQLAGGAAVTTTEDHPFWNHTDQQWQPATTLDPGDHLLTPDGDTITVAGLDPGTAHTGPAYNLTVDGLHTYYVLANDSPVLVHNGHNQGVNPCDLTLGAGPYAREGVGLPGGNINAPGVRDSVNQAGVRYGCHTCGITTPGTPSGNWIPDHQPPTSLVPRGTPQTAYPHCLACARSQGGVVAQINRGNNAF